MLGQFSKLLSQRLKLVGLVSVIVLPIIGILSYIGCTGWRGSGFTLRSPAIARDGVLPMDYTGDGTSATLPLEWSGVPKQSRWRARRR